MARHVLRISDLDQDVFLNLIERSVAFSADPAGHSGILAGRSVGVYFRKTSTRTRASFIVGTSRLGGCPVALGPHDLQTNTGETISDTVRVLSGYLDALVVRTAGDPAELDIMASTNCIPIVNAMTADEHPTQAISDLAMLKRQFGTLGTLRVLYIGEGNNTAASLALAASRVAGMELVLATPPGYTLAPAIVERTRYLSGRFGGTVSEARFFPEACGSFDCIYTTRWQTTGTTKNDDLWRERFAPYRVSEQVMTTYGKPQGAVFMHDMPAVRGEDCDSAVLDGPQSIALQQAKQKLYTAMAVLEWCVSG
jgi:ornithine carbamoyltransferase